ncbi:hypothetical protein H0I23_12865 [Cellulophaga sp. HaHaR_3_176]|uniref:hypothetical protein n=1 Tax=Cellulophaga sp. HaHaR_3_176 TaxID=1942464 RepID=UPI001C1F7811|nr:hypothetical protein [Cellulophaga sp. HaHaR_3_176]QWX83338.1 hypothetical protein H0I23_12865 [Cellulophaga sp. HaHaR_3_176]
MNDVCAHTITTYRDDVIGYALNMHPFFGDKVEVLELLFEIISKEGILISEK